MYAAEQLNVEVVQILCDREAGMVNNYGDSALIQLCSIKIEDEEDYQKQYDIAKLLIKEIGLQNNKQ